MHTIPTARRTVAPVLAGALAVGALAGFGGRPVAAPVSSLTPGAIVRAAGSALEAQKNWELSGSISDAGAALSLNLQSASGGAASQGTLVSHSATIGFLGTIRYVDVAKSSYINAAAPFWRQFVTAGSGLSTALAAKVVNALSGKWIELPAAEAKSFTKALGGLADPRQFGASLFTNNGTLKKGAPTKVAGRSAIPVTSSKGGTIYVSLTGAPLPLKISGGTSTSSGSLTFAYPATLNIAKPPKAKTLTQIEATLLG